MKIHVGRTGSMEYSEVREIATLDDLVALMREAQHPIIIDKPWTFAEEFADCEISIEIYDSYRE